MWLALHFYWIHWTRVEGVSEYNRPWNVFLPVTSWVTSFGQTVCWKHCFRLKLASWPNKHWAFPPSPFSWPCSAGNSHFSWLFQTNTSFHMQLKSFVTVLTLLCFLPLNMVEVAGVAAATLGLWVVNLRQVEDNRAEGEKGREWHDCIATSTLGPPPRGVKKCDAI